MAKNEKDIPKAPSAPTKNTDTLKVGTKKYGGVQVVVEIELPRTGEAFEAFLKRTEPGATDEQIRAAVNRLAERGYRIFKQEQSGARDRLEASTEAERKDKTGLAKIVQTVVTSARATNPPKRTGRPAGPKQITLTPAEQKAMADPVKAAAILASKGIKLTVA